jgi:hypothetical protein
MEPEDLLLHLDKIKSEIETGIQDEQKYGGGLIQTLVHTRVEILRISQSLIEQRMLADKLGAEVQIVITATLPDLSGAQHLEKEIAEQRSKVSLARAEAERYSGGLVQSLAEVTVATERNTLAMLEQQLLVARYGMALPAGELGNGQGSNPVSVLAASMIKPPPPPPPPVLVSRVPEESQALTLPVSIERRKIIPADIFSGTILEQLSFDFRITPSGLKKDARSIKGSFEFCDLFDEVQFSLSYTINGRIVAGQAIRQSGLGFDYNDFVPKQRWIRNTELSDMKCFFKVDQVLYADGSVE